MKPKLTFKQMRILNFIRGYVKDNGKAPTLSEIGVRFDLQVRAVVHHLEALEKKGRLVRTSKWRGITLI